MEGERTSPQSHNNSVQGLAEPLTILFPTRKEMNPALTQLRAAGDLAVPPPALIIHMAFSFHSERIGAMSPPSTSPEPSTYEVVSEHFLNDWMNK